MRRPDAVVAEDLADVVIRGVQEKKGINIVKIDLQELENSVCRFFIICHGNSSTQVSAIAESVEEKVRETLAEKVWHREGLQNAQWVLLDYGDVVVHIFRKEFRDFYDLEGLWADALTEYIEDEIGVLQSDGREQFKRKRTHTGR